MREEDHEERKINARRICRELRRREDVWDVYDERCHFAFCGVRLTNEGRRKYAVALARPCRIVACGGSVRLEVHAENDKEAEEIAE